MRQYAVALKNMAKGLRINKYSYLDMGFLSKAFGYRVSPWGLIPIDNLDGIFEAFNEGALYEYGFAQCLPYINIIVSSYYKFLVNFSTVWTIDEESETLVKTMFVLPFNPEYPEWKVIDFGETIYLHNGYDMYKYDGTDMVSCNTDLQGIICSGSCQALGRVILGGFSNDAYLTDVTKPVSFLDEGCLWWSSIGGKDFVSQVTSSGAEVEEGMLSQEMGFLKCNILGSIIDIRELDPATVVVYGTNGIAYYRQITEPVVTLSESVISKIGVKNRTCIGGYRANQLFISKSNEIYLIGYDDFGNITSSKIGGQEYIEEMGDDIKITYNEEEGDFYIASNQYTLVLNKEGLTQFDKVVHGVVPLKGRLVPLLTKTNKIGDQS